MGETVADERDSLRARAFAYCAAAPDPRELTTLTEALRLGRASCLYAADDGVLLRVDASTDCLLAARDADAVRHIAGLGLADLDKAVVAFADAELPSALGFDPGRGMRYRLCVYERSEPVRLPGTEGLRIVPLTASDVPAVVARYKNVPEEFIARHVSDGWMFGGYDAAGDLVGFVGEHDEGAIGILEVLPEHRRRGYAFELEGWIINHHLAAGRTPFCQVAVDNEASFSLQCKLGMTVLPTVQRWTW